ncbi:hypothetical protein ABW20_dc0109917 [Dactylellina cionopaga]|nr:hypothetical protein ABW20_dc0109917 [Dactylellina cionopaga]
MPGFSVLPTELVHQILSYIKDPTDLANFGLTSKLFHAWSIPSINRNLKITVPSKSGGSERIMKRAFANISTDDRLRYLRDIEIVHSVGDEQGPIVPRHLVIKSRPRKKGGMEAQLLFNIYFRKLLCELAPGQLKSFTYKHNSETYRVKNDTEDIEPFTMSLIATPQNTITKLNIYIFSSLATDCSLFHFPHLTNLTCHSDDSMLKYHCFFTILRSCQDKLLELYCINDVHIRLGPRMWPAHAEPPLSYMEAGYNNWKACRLCQPDNGTTDVATTNSFPSEKKMGLNRLKTWRINGMNLKQTPLFYRAGIIADAPLTHAEIGTSFLSYVGLRSLRTTTLHLDQLFVNTEAPPIKGSHTSDALESYFNSFSGLTSITLNFYENAGLGWLESLKSHADSLTGLHLTSVFGGLIITSDEIEGLGRSLRNLEMLTVKGRKDFFDCIFDPEIFPSLKYFADRPYPARRDCIPEDIIQNIEQRINDNALSPNLRLVCFGSPSHGFLIDTPDSGEIRGVREINDGSAEHERILEDLGGRPRFG